MNKRYSNSDLLKWIASPLILLLLIFSYYISQVLVVADMEQESGGEYTVTRVTDKRIERMTGEEVSYIIDLLIHDKSQLEAIEVDKSLYKSLEVDDKVKYEITKDNKLEIEKIGGK